MVAFHECSVCGYTFAKDLSYEELLAIAEPVPTGESTQTLIAIAKEFNITLLAGFFERDGDRIYKAQVCVDGQGLKAKYRKLHPFINPHILPGVREVPMMTKMSHDSTIRMAGSIIGTASPNQTMNGRSCTPCGSLSPIWISGFSGDRS